MDSKRILVVVHELYTTRMLRAGSLECFDNAYYRGAEWGTRPNSTQRLSIVNLQAIMALRHHLDLDIRTDREWSEDLESKYLEYDVVVLNTISSRVSEDFTKGLLQWKRMLGSRAPQIVLGTEMTWHGRLENGSIGQRDYEDIYFGHTLLRHTGRTDARHYSDDRCHDLRVQEFELGIDLDALPEPMDVRTRKCISVVRAPSGRSTKNNEAIDLFLASVSDVPSLSKYRIQEVAPPYSIADYWEMMAGSTFLLFTSLGETFSYALNDAKALGVVTLFPEVMYQTRVGYRFAADSYPGLGIRYKGLDHALSVLEKLAGDELALVQESEASVRCVEQNFSLSCVKENWEGLLSGQSMNRNGLYLYGAEHKSWEGVARMAREFDRRYAMPIHNEGPLGDSTALSWVDPVSGVVRVMDYASCTESGELVRTLMPPDVGDAPVDRRVRDRDRGDWRRHLQLVCRLNKVSRIVVDAAVPQDLDHELSHLRFLDGLDRGLRPVSISRGMAVT